MPSDYMEIGREILAHGFAFRGQLSPYKSTEQLACSLGELAALGAGSPVHALTPKSTDEAPFNTYSGHYGLGEFPLHTDLANWHQPPRYLMLRCVVGVPDVATTVIDPGPIIEAIGINDLTRALMKPRRRVAGRMSLLPIMQFLDDNLMIRWDERYLEPASRTGETCASKIRQLLPQIEKTSVLLLQQGDTVVIDNWRMFHGRTAASEGCRSRRIERVYLKALRQ